ncbi:MAG: hypothetical protein CMH57_02505 [Myxococcales bacterium]|nr:hypothetical protein [Myxococcales bacterium]
MTDEEDKGQATGEAVEEVGSSAAAEVGEAEGILVGALVVEVIQMNGGELVVTERGIEQLSPARPYVARLKSAQLQSHHLGALFGDDALLPIGLTLAGFATGKEAVAALLKRLKVGRGVPVRVEVPMPPAPRGFGVALGLAPTLVN